MYEKNLRKWEQKAYRLSRVYTVHQNEPITIEIDDDEPEVRNRTIIPVTTAPKTPTLLNGKNPPPRTNGVPTIIRNGALRSQQQLLQNQTATTTTTTPQPAQRKAVAHNVVSSTSTPTPRRPHLLTDADLIMLIQDLQLQKDKAALLVGRFRQWNLLDSGCLLDAAYGTPGGTANGLKAATEFKRRPGGMLVHSTSNSVKRKHQELC